MHRIIIIYQAAGFLYNIVEKTCSGVISEYVSVSFSSIPILIPRNLRHDNSYSQIYLANKYTYLNPNQGLSDLKDSPP